MIEILKAVLFGIVEGVTEWLPISSTGHLILLNEFINLDMSDAFRSMFDVVIQLGAILAVIVLFFHKLNPFSPSKTQEEKHQTWSLWFKVVAAIIPSGVVGVLFDDWMDEHLHNGIVVAIALYFVGMALKQAQAVKDKYIPLILGGISIAICAIYVFATCTCGTGQDIARAIFTAITQGILIAGLSTYVNQIIKQTNKDE